MEKSTPSLTLGLGIPTADGKRLRANLYLPAQGKKFVTVLQLTPYTADNVHAWALHFARRGFAFLAVNVRGRGGSSGRFEPFVADGRDGRDAVEWAAQQAWSDGRVVMTGESYAGFTQWATAAHAPPHLRAINPIAPAYPGWDFPQEGGIITTHGVQWLSFVDGATLNSDLIADAAFQKAHLREQFLADAQVPLTATSTFMVSTLRKWLQHEARDAYWQRMVPAPAQYAAMRIPVLTVTGQYDSQQPGALRYYAEHLRQRREARSPHDLVIGPWDHAGTTEPKQEFADLQFGPKSVFDMPAFVCEWFRWRLGEGPRPRLLPQPVKLYIAGEDKWVDAASLGALPPAGGTWWPRASRGNPDRLARSGLLESTAGPEHVAHFRTRNKDKQQGLLDLDATPAVTFSRDPSLMRGTGLVFLSPPSARSLRIVGRPVVDAWMRIDAPDADLYFSIDELRADGKHVNIARDLLRASFRKGRDRRVPLVPGQWEHIRFFGTHFVARRIARGSQVRLVIDSPLTPALTRNPRTADRDVGFEVLLGGIRGCTLSIDPTASSAT